MNNGAVRLEAVELRRVSLPLVVPFRTSFGTETHRDILLVQVRGPDAVGWGECVAMAEPGYSSEYVDGAHDVIKRHLLPRLVGSPSVAVGDLASGAGRRAGPPDGEGGLGDGGLDASFRVSGIGLSAWLGGVRDTVAAGVSVGIYSSVPALLDAVAGYLDAGYGRIKLKIEQGWDVDVVAAVRSRFGDGLLLQVDANSAYSLSDSSHLAELDAFGLLMIEQPLAVDDLAGHVSLARRLRTPICLDESITSYVACEGALSLGACSIVNIKAGRVGGYLEARRIHDLCAARSVPVWCGGMLETGLGRAANVASGVVAELHPARRSVGFRPVLEAGSDRAVCAGGGHLRVPTGPGIGVTPDPDLLDAVTTSMETIRWE